jgi:hypothetical protein
MTLLNTGTMGGAFLAPLPGRVTGDVFQEGEILIPADSTIGNAQGNVLIQQGTYTITKGSIAAIILKAPNVLQAGTIINITSATAFAHVVTATGLLQDGVTGGAKNTATFPAFAGASITLVASQQKWNVLGLKVVTVP